MAQKEARAREWGWTWDCQAISEPHASAYAVLRVGRIWLGRYTKWSPTGLASEGISIDTPFHAIMNCLDNCDGVEISVPSGFFHSIQEAREFVEYHADLLLREAFPKVV